MKLLFFLIVIAGIYGAVAYGLPNLKRTAVEFVNPAEKETRLLDELAETTRRIGESFSENAREQTGLASSETQALLERSQRLIGEIKGVSESKLAAATSAAASISQLIQQAKESLPQQQKQFSFQDDKGATYVCKPSSE